MNIRHYLSPFPGPSFSIDSEGIEGILPKYALSAPTDPKTKKTPEWV